MSESSTEQKAAAEQEATAEHIAELAKPPSPLRRFGLQIGVLSVGVVLLLIFIMLAPDTFLSVGIYRAFASTTPFFAIVAIPLTFVVITGEIDLSFPAVMALAMAAFVTAWEATNSILLAVVACLVIGVLAGAVNGWFVGFLGIPSIVVTLGTNFFYRGLELVVRDGSGFPLTDERFSTLRSLLVGRPFGIPAQFLWTILTATVLWVLLNRTRFGSHVYLVGDNATSAELMGVKVGWVKVRTFGLVGLFAAFAGMLSSFEVQYFWPTLGDGSLLNTIAAVLLGGTSVFGGVGSIMGTTVGAFIIGAINAGIVSTGLSGFYTQLFFGLIIILSVTLNTLISRRIK